MTNEEYRYRILKALRKIIRETDRYSRKVAAEYGITVPQLICLQTVVEHGSLSTRAVSEEISVSPSTCVGILDRLESKGLVSRERSKRDRRQVLIHPTDKGLELSVHAPSMLQDHFCDNLATQPESEQEAIAAAMDRVVRLMDIGDEDAAPVLHAASDLLDESHESPVATPHPTPKQERTAQPLS